MNIEITEDYSHMAVYGQKAYVGTIDALYIVDLSTLATQKINLDDGVESIYPGETTYVSTNSKLLTIVNDKVSSIIDLPNGSELLKCNNDKLYLYDRCNRSVCEYETGEVVAQNENYKPCCYGSNLYFHEERGYTVFNTVTGEKEFHSLPGPVDRMYAGENANVFFYGEHFIIGVEQNGVFKFIDCGEEQLVDVSIYKGRVVTLTTDNKIRVIENVEVTREFENDEDVFVISQDESHIYYVGVDQTLHVIDL